MDVVHILAANLNRVIEWHRTKKTGKPTSNAGIASAASVSSNTVGRARRGDGEIGIGSLAAIGRVFKLSPSQLLAPGLDPTDPPELVSDDAEKRLLIAFRDRRKNDRPPASH